MLKICVCARRLWGLCLLLPILVACQAPPLLHGLQLWDSECSAVTDQVRTAPRLESLLSPAVYQERAEQAAQLYAPVPRADLLTQALELRPELKAEAISGFPPRLYAKGETENFWITNPMQDGIKQVEARLLRVSDNSYTWVASESKNADAYLKDLTKRFDKEVYKPAQWLYGFEVSEGMDQDPRIHLLFAPNLGNVLGYFNSSAGVSKLALPQSNEKDMLFLNLDYMGEESQDLDVLAHELQHLIHWFHDPSEQGFLNEGLSELAPALIFSQLPDRLIQNMASYARNPNLQLNDWSQDGDLGLNHYGAGSAFAAYLTETFGPEFLTEIVREPLPGIGGLNNLLAQRGCEFAFDDLFADFAVANLAQAPRELGTAARLGYASMAQRLRSPASDRYFETQFQFKGQSTVNGVLPPYAVHYIDLAGSWQGDTVEISFQGEAAVPFVIPEFEPPLMWSNRVNGSVVRLARIFDLSSLEAGADVRLETEMWWDIEDGWDYGYVSVSRDGLDWDLLTSSATTAADPNGLALGQGLTGLPISDSKEGEMIRTSWDLSPFAGEMLHLRFDYVTDGAITSQGWQIGGLTIEAIGFQEDFSGELEDWSNEGWVQVREKLPVAWLVQAVHLGAEGTVLLDLERHIAAPDGSLQLALPAPSDSENLYLLVTPLAPLVTTKAEYEIQLVESPAS